MSDLSPTRDTVFVAGGQPSFTYVDRAHLGIEQSFDRALKIPNQIASIAGPTKSGKTVLCKKLLSGRSLVWVEGGQIETGAEIWEKICYALNHPVEIEKTSKGGAKAGITVGIKDVLSADASLSHDGESKKSTRSIQWRQPFVISMNTALH